jgi:hypothetical protein
MLIGKKTFGLLCGFFFVFVFCGNALCDYSKAPGSPPVSHLASDPQWLALLHMRKGLDGVYRSEVDAPSFFLSGSDRDAVAELQATLKALDNKDKESQSAWCRFPARAQFLVEKGFLQASQDLQCEELDYWRGRFSTDEIVLVSPEPYLKNVASVFGHTFLRLDAADKVKHPVLLSKALNYYADVGSTGSTVAYIAKGLTGHFPGIIEVAPYFQKLRKYSDNEDRDIWEYKLTLSKEQIQMFIDHVWEVKGHSFNYFFLDENCSYRLIALLDVVTPTHRVREDFYFDALPLDTVRAFQKHGLIAESTYVPSARKRFYEQLSSLNAAQRKQLMALMNDELYYDDIDDLKVMAVMSRYNGLQMQVEPERRPLHTMQVNKLIRKQYESGQILPADSTQLKSRDPLASGHDRVRMQMGWQHEDGKDALLLGMRAAYHDFHDPQSAYQRGIQMDVLDVLLRVADNNQSDETSLEKMRWFGLQSYSPGDDFFANSSWGFNVSRQRELIDDQRELLNVVDGYRGLTRTCGELLCHAEFVGGILTGSPLDLGWTARAGFRTGLLYQQDQWSWSADVTEQYYLVGDPDRVDSITMEAGYSLARNLSLYTAYNLEKNSEENRERFTVSLRYFF